jgi:hypothetical protein
MKDMRKLAIAAIVVGFVGLLIGVISKLMHTELFGISARAFGDFTAICFLLSINFLLLDKKS